MKRFGLSEPHCNFYECHVSLDFSCNHGGLFWDYIFSELRMSKLLRPCGWNASTHFNVTRINLYIYILLCKKGRFQCVGFICCPGRHVLRVSSLLRVSSSSSAPLMTAAAPDCHTMRCSILEALTPPGATLGWGRGSQQHPNAPWQQEQLRNDTCFHVGVKNIRKVSNNTSKSGQICH